MDKPKTLKKKDILKLIEAEIGPDGPSHTEAYIFHENPDFAKALMTPVSIQINDIKVSTIANDMGIVGHLIRLTDFTVTWISAIDPDDVKGYTNYRHHPSSPWAKNSKETTSEARK
ncbi:hypothetical protein ACLK29_04725 [Leptospira kirschneri]|uniref:hypothetical protein n=1 Tax=Leptospira kirschneri TaxID=29507 RepID=UPI00398A6925